MLTVSEQSNFAQLVDAIYLIVLIKMYFKRKFTYKLLSFSYYATIKANKDTNLNNFTHNSFGGLIYLSNLHYHKIMVLCSHTFPAYGIS